MTRGSGLFAFTFPIVLWLRTQDWFAVFLGVTLFVLGMAAGLAWGMYERHTQKKDKS